MSARDAPYGRNSFNYGNQPHVHLSAFNSGLASSPSMISNDVAPAPPNEQRYVPSRVVSPGEQTFISSNGSYNNQRLSSLPTTQTNGNGQIVLQPPSPPTSPGSLGKKPNAHPNSNNHGNNGQSRNLAPLNPGGSTITFHSKRRCISCGSDQSPCWRPSWSAAAGQLCNSCGLRYKKTNARCLNKSCGRVPAKGEWLTIKNAAVKGPDGRMHYQCFYCGGEIELKKPLRIMTKTCMP